MAREGDIICYLNILVFKLTCKDRTEGVGGGRGCYKELQMTGTACSKAFSVEKQNTSEGLRETRSACLRVEGVSRETQEDTENINRGLDIQV